MPVRVRIVAERHLITILELDQTGHGVWARAIHPDLPVVVQGHEGERRVDRGIYDRDVQAKDLLDAFPVVHRRAAQRVDSELQAGGADGVHVDDAAEVPDVWQDEVLRAGRRGLHGCCQGHTLDPGIAGPQKLVGAVLDPAGDVSVGRAAVRGIVLEAAVFRWVV